MKIEAALLALVAGAGAVYAAGVFVDSPPLAARGALVALSALAGYVVVAGRGAAGWVRWPLAIAVLAVGLAAAMLALLARNVWVVAGAPASDPDGNRLAQVMLAIAVPCWPC